MVQVKLLSVPEHVDAVAAPRDVLVVQRLVQVADEVNDKLGGLRAAPGRQVGVKHLLRVVGQRRDDAAGGLAVALQVDAA